MDKVCDDVSRVGRERHSNPKNLELLYGTSGFRANSEVLDHVVYRMGVLAAIRSSMTLEATGVMITASHNPVEYNGVKLIDSKDNWPDAKWEQVANRLVNASDEELGPLLRSLMSELGLSELSTTATVCVGRDTRASGAALVASVCDGVEAVGSRVKNFDVVSTPQLHFIVSSVDLKKLEDEGKVSNAYFEKLGTAFQHATGKYDVTRNYKPKLLLDASNGVGSVLLRRLQPHLVDLLEVEIFNDGSQAGDVINDHCGADYLKTQIKPPKGMESLFGERCASVDGDVDRIVFWYVDAEERKLHLLDGDKIGSLIALSITNLLQAVPTDLKVAVIQTAYTNGAATQYIREQLGVQVECVATGVKNLQRRARDFDVAIYFEANGHGTVVFSSKAMEAIRKEAWQTNSVRAQKLMGLIDLIHQSTTDGLSNLLLVEAILRDKGWSVRDWDALYVDKPSILRQFGSEKSNLLKTNEKEDELIEPKELKQAINKIVNEFQEARAFVRASGTETNTVRVYAEAKNRDEVVKLADQVCEVVQKHLN